MNNEWKLPSEKMLPVSDRMNDDLMQNILSNSEDIAQNKMVQYHEALLQSEVDLKEALRLLDKSSQPMMMGAMEDFTKERKVFLDKFRK